MVSKAAKIRLGIFVFIGTAILTLFFILVAGNRLIQRRDTYYIRFHNYSVNGLQIGGAVNYNGIQVGRVEEITIDSKDVTSVVVTISLEHGTPIKADNEVTLVFIGITGIKALEISGGTNTSKMLKPGSYIRPGATQLDELSGKAFSIVDKVNEIAANINRLTGEENRENVTNILRETSLLLEYTRTNFTATLESISKIATNTAGVTEGMGSNFTRITDNLTKNMDSLTTATTRNIGNIGDQSTASLERLTNELSLKLDFISANLNNSISELTIETNALLADTRMHLNNIGTHSDAMILDTSKQIAEMTVKINSALSHVDQMFASPEFNDLIGNLSKLAAQVNEANVKGLVGELSITVNKAGLLMTSIDRTLTRNRTNLTEILQSLREATDNLNEFTRQIADQPSVIIRGN